MNLKEKMLPGHWDTSPTLAGTWHLSGRLRARVALILRPRLGSFLSLTKIHRHSLLFFITSLSPEQQSTVGVFASPLTYGRQVANPTSWFAHFSLSLFISELTGDKKIAKINKMDGISDKEKKTWWWFDSIGGERKNQSLLLLLLFLTEGKRKRVALSLSFSLFIYLFILDYVYNGYPNWFLCFWEFGLWQLFNEDKNGKKEKLLDPT